MSSKQTTRFVAQYEWAIPGGGDSAWHDWQAPWENHAEAEEALQSLVLQHRRVGGGIQYSTGRFRVICRSVVVTENLIGDLVDLNAIPV